MFFVTGTVGKLKIRVNSVVESDFEDAKSTAHVLAAHGIDQVSVVAGKIPSGEEPGDPLYVVEPDGYGHLVRAAA